MNIFAPLLLALLGQADPSLSDLSANDMLRRAQNNYAYGEYTLAITLVEKALSEEVSLSSPDERIAARELLGLSSYLAKDLDKSLGCLHGPFAPSPKARSGPVFSRAADYRVLRSIRKELEPQLKALTQAEPPPQPEQEREPRGERSQIIERNIVERSPLGLFMPFGFGQYQNGDMTLGHTLLGVQLTALAVNIGAYYLARSYRRDPELGRMFSQLQYGGLAFFGLSWSAGVVQARLNFVPRVVRPPIIRQARGGSEDMPMIEAHATLTLTTW